MRKLGMVTMITILTAACVAMVVGIKSIPDVKRYLRIRSM